MHENKPIPRETIEAKNKLKSEVLLEEQKIILGWLIGFHQLLIRLLKNKFVVWPEAIISKMIKDGALTEKECTRPVGQPQVDTQG
jgi:hypothetical protein